MRESEPIHPWRWRFLWLWMLVFTIIVFLGIRQNRSAVHDLRESKASIVSLERTNCALRSFLFTAFKTRKAQALKEENPRHASDIAAARGYYKLYILFQKDGCSAVLENGR